MKLVSLAPVRRGDWIVKASVLDDQILIFFQHSIIMVVTRVVMFYNEDDAYKYIERIIEDDSCFKTNQW